MRRLRASKEAIKKEIREHRSSFFVYIFLRTLVLITMVLQIFNQNYENAFLCILTLFLMIIPSFIQVEFKIELPSTLEIIILLFIFSAEILGEIQSFYIRVPVWDTILHTLNGFLAAAIGFSLVDLMNKDTRIKFQLSPLFMAIVAFCFSMTIGVIWEFFEFGMDTFAGLDMQKDTIINHITSVTLDPTKTNIPITIDGIKEVIINGKALGVGFSLVDLMNKDTRIKFQLSPLFMAIVAFCFSMTIGVIWEFFEFGMDTFAGLDMQKDTIINHITSVTLDPTKTNIPITIDGIKEVIINGKALGVGGYIDIGLIDTMYDLFVNFIGAIVFSFFGYFYVVNRGKGNFVNRFIPRLKDRDHH